VNRKRGGNKCPHTAKTQYATEEDAEDGLSFMLTKIPGYTGQPYFCLYCHTWHLGRKNPPHKRRRKRT